MFIENKYSKLYYTIISRAKSRVTNVNSYYEKHHILPKSLGGNNSKDNLVRLTPREHFICHKLLIKFTEGNEKRKMVFALMRILRSKDNIHSITSSEYERLKNLWSNSKKIEWQDIEYRKTTIEKMKESWTLERKLNFSKKIKEVWTDPVRKKNAAERMKSYYSDENNRKKLSEIQKRLHKENKDIGKKKSQPGELNGMYGKTHTTEVRKKISKITKERLSNKSYIEIYGEEKANQLKMDRSIKLKSFLRNNPGIRNGANNSNAKECLITTPYGDKIKTTSLKTFCKENKISYWGLGEVARGNIPEYKGWKITYI